MQRNPSSPSVMPSSDALHAQTAVAVAHCQSLMRDHYRLLAERRALLVERRRLLADLIARCAATSGGRRCG